MADETIRIKELPEIYELPDGMMVPVDSNSVGTRKIDLKHAIEQYGGGGDGKMDKDNPVGTGSFSMNRMPGNPEDVGEYSATLNNLNIAKGAASTAEGYRTVAGGVYSHTEGVATMATPVGGESTQMAIAAHAEGSGGIAGGDYSHVEGGNTLANNITEHAEGNYNKSNYNSNNWGDPLNTLHSVGCGTGGTEGGPEQERKNAHEIMQNGDHYVMGIGGYDGTNPGEADTLQDVINAMKGSVVVTLEFSPDAGRLVADRTYAQIMQDVDSGRTVMLRNSNHIFMLSSAENGGEITFTTSIVDKQYFTQGADCNNTVVFFVDANDMWGSRSATDAGFQYTEDKLNRIPQPDVLWLKVQTNEDTTCGIRINALGNLEWQVTGGGYSQVGDKITFTQPGKEYDVKVKGILPKPSSVDDGQFILNKTDGSAFTVDILSFGGLGRIEPVGGVDYYAVRIDPALNVRHIRSWIGILPYSKIFITGMPSILSFPKDLSGLPDNLMAFVFAGCSNAVDGLSDVTGLADRMRNAGEISSSNFSLGGCLKLEFDAVGIVDEMRALGTDETIFYSTLSGCYMANGIDRAYLLIGTPDPTSRIYQWLSPMQLIDRYKRYGVCWLQYGKTDTDHHICEAQCELTQGGVDTLRMTICDPDNPGGRITWTINNNSSAYPAPTYIPASTKRFMAGPANIGGNAIVTSANGIWLPTNNAPSNSVSWHMNAMQAVCDMQIRPGERFELRLNGSPMQNNSYKCFVALAKITEMTNHEIQFSILTAPIAPRYLYGVRNSIYPGMDATDPIVFTFKTAATFTPGENIYLMIGADSSDPHLNDSCLFAGMGCEAMTDKWYSETDIVLPAYAGYTLDGTGASTEASITDQTLGVVGDDFVLKDGTSEGKTMESTNPETPNITIVSFSINASSGNIDWVARHKGVLYSKGLVLEHIPS